MSGVTFKFDSLCWYCKHAVPNDYDAGCIWSISRGVIPVEGWDAEPTKLYGGSGMPIESYRVKDCPQFVRDGYPPKGNRGQSLVPAKLSRYYVINHTTGERWESIQEAVAWLKSQDNAKNASAHNIYCNIRDASRRHGTYKGYEWRIYDRDTETEAKE